MYTFPRSPKNCVVCERLPCMRFFLKVTFSLTISLIHSFITQYRRNWSATHSFMKCAQPRIASHPNNFSSLYFISIFLYRASCVVFLFLMWIYQKKKNKETTREIHQFHFVLTPLCMAYLCCCCLS